MCEEPEATEGRSVSIEALVQWLPANEAAIVRPRLLERQSLRRVAGEIGISTMTVSRHEKAALAALREQLALSSSGAGQPAPNSPLRMRKVGP